MKFVNILGKQRVGKKDFNLSAPMNDNGYLIVVTLGNNTTLPFTDIHTIEWTQGGKHVVLDNNMECDFKTNIKHVKISYTKKDL